MTPTPPPRSLNFPRRDAPTHHRNQAIAKEATAMTKKIYVTSAQRAAGQYIEPPLPPRLRDTLRARPPTDL